MAGAITVDDTSFKKVVLESSRPVLVDFWATWCAPCIMMEAPLENLAREFEGRMLMAKIDVEQNSRTASRYGVSALPTLVIFQDGQIVDWMTGALPKKVLREKIEAFLAR